MGIARAALIIMLGNMVSRLMGVVREQVIAGLFGASAATDAFTAAARVPITVYDLLIGGIISAALIPVFSDYADPGQERELRRVWSTVLNLVSLVLLVALAVLMMLARPLMSLFAPGFPATTLDLAVQLVLWMLPSVLFMGWAGVFTGLLYAQRRFTAPAFAAACYNMGIVAMALLFHRPLGVHSLVLGVLLGALVQAGVLAVGLRKVGYRGHMELAHPGVKRLLALYGPVALGLVVSAVGVAIDTNLASRTGEGNLAALRFATTLVQFPLGLVAAAASFAVLPTLSRYATIMAGQPTMVQASTTVSAGIQEETPLPTTAPKDEETLSPETAHDAFRQTLVLGMKLVLLAILPATVGLVVLREPVVRLLFQHGAFDAEATQRTALAFLAYSPGLPAAAIDQLLIFAFYGRKNTVTPVLVGVLGWGVYLLAAVTPIAPITMPRLALANATQLTFHALVMLLLLWRALGGLQGLGLGQTLAKTALASAVMGGGLAAYWRLFGGAWESGHWSSLALALGIALLVGGGLYIGSVTALRLPAAKELWSIVRARLKPGTPS